MIISLLIFIFIIVFGIVEFNLLTKRKMAVGEAKSAIDVYLKQRFDLIPNLVSTTKGYCQYEESTINKVIDLRNSYYSDKNLKVGGDLDAKVNRMVAIAEGYSELKANEQYSELMKNLVKMESQIQAARRLYNIEVTNYNNLVKMFPSNIIAIIGKFKIADLFEIIDENEKENIKINMEK